MKRLLSLFLLLSLMLIPISASAAGSGIYVAPKIIMDLSDSGNISKDNFPVRGSLDSHNQWAFGGGVAAGFDFWQYYLIPLRVELEATFRANTEHTWDAYNGGNGSLKGTWNSTTLFLNAFYDFHTDFGLTPYVGGGLGFAFKYAEFSWDTPATSGSANENPTNFAWQLGFGISYNFTEDIAADLGYKYINLGETKVSQGAYSITMQPYLHEFALGIRFNF